MPGQKLTDDELREAAAEAGISPRELQLALAERSGGRNIVPSPLGPSQHGGTTIYVEGQLDLDQSDALLAVKRSIERQVGKTGHKQDEHEADIVDDDHGLTYRIRTADDGNGGALVRVDIDPRHGQGNQALASIGVSGASATLLALGWLFGVLVFWIGGLAFGALGGLLLARSLINLKRSTKFAQGVASQALMEADDEIHALRSLPSSRR